MSWYGKSKSYQRERELAQSDGMNCRGTKRLGKFLAGKLTPKGYSDGTKYNDPGLNEPMESGMQGRFNVSRGIKP